VLQNQVRSISANIEQLSVEYNELVNQFNAAIRKSKEENALVQRIQRELQAAVEQSQANIKSAAHYRNKQQHFEHILGPDKERFEVQDEAYCQSYDTAMKRFGPVHITRNADEINRELVKLVAKLKEKKKEYGGRELFLKKIKKAEVDYETAKKEIQEHRSTTSLLATARANRQKMTEKFKKIVTIRCQRLFASLVGKRGFRGRLDIDHEHRVLELRVLIEIYIGRSKWTRK
jgi:chromosome segregation ATPase